MRELLDRGEVATCGPVVAELLAGADGEVAERMWVTLSSMSWARLASSDWQLVGTIAHRLRQAGQALPLTDLAIAVAATRAGYVLWSLDSDFERIAQVLDGLELYRSAR